MAMDLKESYNLLGLPLGASEEEVKRAYKQKARECHPDKNLDDPEATEKFQALGQAYETIASGSDPEPEESEFFSGFFQFVIFREMMRRRMREQFMRRVFRGIFDEDSDDDNDEVPFGPFGSFGMPVFNTRPRNGDSRPSSRSQSYRSRDQGRSEYSRRSYENVSSQKPKKESKGKRRPPPFQTKYAGQDHNAGEGTRAEQRRSSAGKQEESFHSETSECGKGEFHTRNNSGEREKPSPAKPKQKRKTKGQMKASEWQKGKKAGKKKPNIKVSSASVFKEQEEIDHVGAKTEGKLYSHGTETSSSVDSREECLLTAEHGARKAGKAQHEHSGDVPVFQNIGEAQTCAEEQTQSNKQNEQEGCESQGENLKTENKDVFEHGGINDTHDDVTVTDTCDAGFVGGNNKTSDGLENGRDDETGYVESNDSSSPADRKTPQRSCNDEDDCNKGDDLLADVTASLVDDDDVRPSDHLEDVESIGEEKTANTWNTEGKRYVSREEEEKEKDCVATEAKETKSSGSEACPDGAKMIPSVEAEEETTESLPVVERFDREQESIKLSQQHIQDKKEGRKTARKRKKKGKGFGVHTAGAQDLTEDNNLLKNTGVQTFQEPISEKISEEESMAGERSQQDWVISNVAGNSGKDFTYPEIERSKLHRTAEKLEARQCDGDDDNEDKVHTPVTMETNGGVKVSGDHDAWCSSKREEQMSTKCGSKNSKGHHPASTRANRCSTEHDERQNHKPDVSCGSQKRELEQNSGKESGGLQGETKMTNCTGEAEILSSERRDSCLSAEHFDVVKTATFQNSPTGRGKSEKTPNADHDHWQQNEKEGNYKCERRESRNEELRETLTLAEEGNRAKIESCSDTVSERTRENKDDRIQQFESRRAAESKCEEVKRSGCDQRHDKQGGKSNIGTNSMQKQGHTTQSKGKKAGKQRNPNWHFPSQVNNEDDKEEVKHAKTVNDTSVNQTAKPVSDLSERRKPQIKEDSKTKTEALRSNSISEKKPESPTKGSKGEFTGQATSGSGGFVARKKNDWQTKQTNLKKAKDLLQNQKSHNGLKYHQECQSQEKIDSISSIYLPENSENCHENSKATTSKKHPTKVEDCVTFESGTTRERDRNEQVAYRKASMCDEETWQQATKKGSRRQRRQQKFEEQPTTTIWDSVVSSNQKPHTNDAESGSQSYSSHVTANVWHTIDSKRRAQRDRNGDLHDRTYQANNIRPLIPKDQYDEQKQLEMALRLSQQQFERDTHEQVMGTVGNLS